MTEAHQQVWIQNHLDFSLEKKFSDENTTEEEEEEQTDTWRRDRSVNLPQEYFTSLSLLFY